MKKGILIFWFCIIILSLSFGQSRVAKIFYVNLYSVPVDIRLGDEDNYIFYRDALESYDSTYLLEVEDFGDYMLYFKTSGEKEWYYWGDDNSQPYYCEVRSGKTHCIVVGVDGRLAYYFLEEPRGKGPKICFLNGTDSELSTMEVGKEFGDYDVAYVEDLSQDTVTNFVVFKEGRYSLYWEFPWQKNRNKYFFYPDETGMEPERILFENNRYYLFLAYSADQDDYAFYIDITP
ncbi:MAG: hypothetical protein MJB14_10555 [Spirochaetes bacterium]|nr:hypothetical protein [Spirochaetota bacterium]